MTTKENEELLTEAGRRLGDIAKVDTMQPGSDVYMIRVGNKDEIGELTSIYSPNHAGIKLHRYSDQLKVKVVDKLNLIRESGFYDRITTDVEDMKYLSVIHIRKLMI